MDTLLEKASDIIRAASATQLALYAFCILVTAVLVVALFRRAVTWVRLVVFLVAVVLMAAVIVLALPRPTPDPTPPPPRPTTEWKHKRFKDGKEAARVLELEYADPSTIYALMLDRADILVWWRRGEAEFAFEYKSFLWDSGQVPSLFQSDTKSSGVKRIPIGIGTVNGRAVFVYFEARRVE